MEKRILDPNNSFKKMKKGNVKINNFQIDESFA